MITGPLGSADESAGVAFRSVVCGVDSSPQSAEAPRQAIQLAEDEARLWAVSVWDPNPAFHAGIHAGRVARDLREQASVSLQRAQDAYPALKAVMVKGGDVAGLLASASNLDADLISVGSHGTSRPAGVVFGSVATALVHYAPCPVLIARKGTRDQFPRVLLHGGDGSGDSLQAARVAGRIAARHDATVITATMNDDLDRGSALAEESGAAIRAAGVEPQIRAESGSPHRRIVELAKEVDADLVIVGSRGHTGLDALGSVSERVAHRASCSVLVVRRPTHPVEESDVGDSPD